MISLRAIGCVLFIGVLTTGCVNLEPTPDETRFFTLGIGSPAQDSGEAKKKAATRVGVRVASVSDYLRGSGIVVRHGPYEVKYSQGNRWAAGLENAMSRVLTDGLRKELPTLSIVASDGVRSDAPELVVEVDVIAAEGTDEGDAVLELSWRILGGAARESKPTGHYAKATSGWNQSDFGQLAAMLSELAGDAAMRMAADVAAAAAGLEVK